MQAWCSGEAGLKKEYRARAVEMFSAGEYDAAEMAQHARHYTFSRFFFASQFCPEMLPWHATPASSPPFLRLPLSPLITTHNACMANPLSPRSSPITRTRRKFSSLVGRLPPLIVLNTHAGFPLNPPQHMHHCALSDAGRLRVGLSIALSALPS